MLTFVKFSKRQLISLLEILCQEKVKFSLYLQYYAEACTEWRGPSPRLAARTTPTKHLRRDIKAGRVVGNTVSELTSPGIERQTSLVDSDVNFNYNANWPQNSCNISKLNQAQNESTTGRSTNLVIKKKSGKF